MVTITVRPVAPPHGVSEQHRAGRAAAAAALSRAGAPRRSVPRAPDGRPLFPPAFPGSISHTDRVAVAAVLPGASGVGVDVESADIDARVARFVFDERERAELLDPGDPRLTRAMYSAKEAAFKAFSTLKGRKSKLFWQIRLQHSSDGLIARDGRHEARVWVHPDPEFALALAVCL